MSAAEVQNNADITKTPRNSPQIRAFAVIAGAVGHGRIPLRFDAEAPYPKTINFQFFIEKPREFIEFCRIFRKLLFALN